MSKEVGGVQCIYGFTKQDCRPLWCCKGIEY